jgi:hypothetical protein
MILQHLVQTNLLVINKIPIHSWESAIMVFFVTLTSFSLFIFWTRKKALLNFQAWSLLMGLINLILLFHFSPISIHIREKGFEYQFTSNVIRLLMFLMFLTTTITMWRFWKLSEKYIPKDMLYQSRYINKIKQPEQNHMKENILMRGLALWHTIKHGGNNNENTEKIKKNIYLTVKN